MNVAFTDAAEADFEAIGDYIAGDNPDAAVTFVQDMRESCLALADMPRRYGLIHGHESSGLRRLIHTPYLIFYRVQDDRVFIVRILHGAMDHEAILFPND